MPKLYAGRAEKPDRFGSAPPGERLPFIYRYLRILCQEVWIQSVLLLAVSHWSEIRDLEGWLIGTAEKRCMVYRRERGLRRRRFAQLDPTTEPATAPAQARWELLADVDAASRRLPATQRRLVALRYQLGLTATEAADAIGLARSSGRKILNRAVARLREQLDEPTWPGARPQRRGSASAPDRREALTPPPEGWAASVKVHRERLEVSQLEAAGQVGTSRAYLAQVERGREPSAALAIKLRRWLETEARAGARRQTRGGPR